MQGWKLRPQAGADRRGGQPDADRKPDENHQRGGRRQHRDRDQQHGGNARARQQHRSLAAAVHELTEARAADADRQPVRAGDDAGGGERAGEVLHMDQEADAEHRQRQPRKDREGEQASRAGG